MEPSKAAASPLPCPSLSNLTPDGLPLRPSRAGQTPVLTVSPLRLGSPGVVKTAALSLLPALLLLCGCAGPRLQPALGRRFDFRRDTFAYANQLTWEYGYDAQGKWVSHRRDPPPDYSLHCFVVSRSAAQFFVNARFDPAQPGASDTVYRKLIQQVVSTNLRHPLTEDKKIIIPGYADLRAFSQAHPNLLKAECGSALQGYFQRGNWRMVMPFTRHEQENMARQLVEHLKQGRPVIVHVSCFPSLTINHAMLLFDAQETERQIQFQTYDPNNPQEPTTLTYDRERRTFQLPANSYFPGGPVNAYQVYWAWWN